MARLDRVIDTARQGALLREGLRVVIAGQPNAGKSSLLNALAGAELAIVTPIPGTTRDKISETLQIEGVPVHVVDTAGLREVLEAGDEVERIGIARSWQAIAEADAVLLLHDLTRAADPAYVEADRAIAARLPAAARVVHVYNKADAAPQAAATVPRDAAEDVPAVILSARTQAGLQDLRRTLLTLAGWQAAPEGVYLARERHVLALRAAQAHLAEAGRLADRADGALDLLAEELRLAHDALGEITGVCTPDDLLGVIFSRFCIGK
jgi:tRNA modification GTPase